MLKSLNYFLYFLKQGKIVFIVVNTKILPKRMHHSYQHFLIIFNSILFVSFLIVFYLVIRVKMSFFYTGIFFVIILTKKGLNLQHINYR
jgi:hypothetical protein